MATRPVTPEEREEIRRLHGEGKGRNEIAKLLQRSGKTISVHAETLGSPGGDLSQREVLTQVHECDERTLGRRQLAPAVTTPEER